MRTEEHVTQLSWAAAKVVAPNLQLRTVDFRKALGVYAEQTIYCLIYRYTITVSFGSAPLSTRSGVLERD